MKYLVLFDIDGTILNFRHGIAKQLFAEMLKELFGRDVPDSAIPQFHGMTDLQIIRSISENIGISYQDTIELIPQIWKKMLVMFQQHSLPENVTVLPGVPDLIKTLSENDEVRLGLITGNFLENAYLKLSIAGLDSYFPTGAFGCDSEDRNMLPPIAIMRINQHYNTQLFASHNTIIIGDTHRDIECARKNGIKVIAVATGGFTNEELNSQAPDAVLNDLGDTSYSLKTIYSLLNSN
ncbi:MAG: HAD hydrolase-like protein [Candidatus Kapabacteria bacterium]|nr:HAD hydrolase-like protein [Ignavibacteriota bacterium]MCW5884789.1 HAD hydrolase-like protein [Candidatus Kapabacteria bacterium]